MSNTEQEGHKRGRVLGRRRVETETESFSVAAGAPARVTRLSCAKHRSGARRWP